jgi:hypothetical protein
VAGDLEVANHNTMPILEAFSQVTSILDQHVMLKMIHVRSPTTEFGRADHQPTKIVEGSH